MSETETNLWQAYKNHGCLKARDKLINMHYWFVGFLAKKMDRNLHGTVELGDLIGVGSLGLLDAIERFDLSRKLEFKTYAELRIRGEIMDSLRKTDYLPKGARAQLKLMDAAKSTLEQVLYRVPTTAEIADYLKLTKIQYSNMERAAAMENVYQERNVVTTTIADQPAPDAFDPEKVRELTELRNRLEHGLRLLKPRLKKLILMYYFEGKKMQEIGKYFGICGSRASQLHNRALRILKPCFEGLRI